MGVLDRQSEGLGKPNLGLLSALATDAAVIGCTVTAGSLAVLGALITRSGRPVHAVEGPWASLVVRACRMHIEIEGRERLEPNRPYVIISNHQSHLDICATRAALNRKILFVAKKELLSVPIFGQALGLSDHIVIDRSDAQSAIDAVNEAAIRSPDQACILFYAEGTRSSDGSITAFKKGGVALALRCGLPIVPLAISGTRKFLPKGAALIRPGGAVRIFLAPPIETAGLSVKDRDALNEQVHRIIVANFVPNY